MRKAIIQGVIRELKLQDKVIKQGYEDAFVPETKETLEDYYYIINIKLDNDSSYIKSISLSEDYILDVLHYGYWGLNKKASIKVETAEDILNFVKKELNIESLA